MSNIAAQQMHKIFSDMKADMRVRLVRIKSRGCTCQGGDDMCDPCVAEELLDTLNTTGQRFDNIKLGMGD